MNRYGVGRQWLWAIASGLFLQGAPLPVPAQVVTLSDLNSTATVNLGPGAGNSVGMTRWTLDGIDNLAQQWFWYRVGSAGPEQPINTIGGLTFSQPNPRTLYATYFNGQYGVTINYLLTGSSTPANVFDGFIDSDISESISITNATLGPLPFHFFQYSNFNLAGTPGSQTVTLGKNLRGLFNEADQTLGFGAVIAALSETVVTPGANRGEVGLFNSTLAKLSDGNTDDLNNDSGPLTGDATWAFQWDFSIPAGSSVGITKDKYLELALIPEPSSVLLLSFGLAALVLRKRRLL